MAGLNSDERLRHTSSLTESKVKGKSITARLIMFRSHPHLNNDDWNGLQDSCLEWRIQGDPLPGIPNDVQTLLLIKKTVGKLDSSSLPTVKRNPSGFLFFDLVYGSVIFGNLFDDFFNPREESSAYQSVQYTMIK